MPPRRNPRTHKDATNLRPKSNEEPVRLAPFADPTGKIYQKNSDRINTRGQPRPEACFGCFGKFNSMKLDHEHGRGVSTHNETFSCLVLKGYGNDGEDCARCVGLGQPCVDVPEQLWDEAWEFLCEMPEWNEIVVKPVNTRTAAEKQKIQEILAAGKELYRVLHAHKKKVTKDAKAAGMISGNPHKGTAVLPADRPATIGQLEKLEEKVDRVLALSEQMSKDALASRQAATSSRDLMQRMRHTWNLREQALHNADASYSAIPFADSLPKASSDNNEESEDDSPAEDPAPAARPAKRQKTNPRRKQGQARQ
ncbi:hypothetical protein F5884DRAFT_758896 [Xylogone sp. PMI_703]|nr:hypothetical protein F5884DRAFT_758896 [Xylogone sp. PMI_703]